LVTTSVAFSCQIGHLPNPNSCAHVPYLSCARKLALGGSARLCSSTAAKGPVLRARSSRGSATRAGLPSSSWWHLEGGPGDGAGD
jgi:hypothetical protein